MLQRDGDIVDVDGTSPLSAFLVEGDKYYISIHHRNHLDIRSDTTFTLTSTTTTANFSTSSGLILGGTNAVTTLDNGFYGLYSGDYDENGQVQSSDISSVVILLGGSGYSNADMDMNGQIQSTDINNILYINIGKGEQF